MTTTPTPLSIDTILHGEVHSRIDEELAKIAGNVLDGSTVATAPRTLTVKITFKPSDLRILMDAKVDVKSTLAPPESVRTKVAVDQTNREPVLVEHPQQQEELFGGRK